MWNFGRDSQEGEKWYPQQTEISRSRGRQHGCELAEAFAKQLPDERSWLPSVLALVLWPQRSGRGSGRLRHDRLRAVRATAGGDGNFTQAFRTLSGWRVGRSRSLVHARDQQIDWGDDEEVNRGSDQKE